jgi:hypothetical protein
MPQVAFTPQLRRFTATPEVTSGAATLRAALEDAFCANPQLRGYVLDDQGHLRANVVAFIDAEPRPLRRQGACVRRRRRHLA